MWNAFIFLLTLLVRVIRSACKARDELMLENLALRQQVTALKLERHKPKLRDADRAFWIALCSSWSNWASRLLIVKPETVAHSVLESLAKSRGGTLDGDATATAASSSTTMTASRWKPSESWIGSLTR